MILNEKGIVKEFELVIYPIHFVAVIGEVDEDEINKAYAPNNEMANWIGCPQEGAAASTYCVHRKDDNQQCVMIWIPKLENCTGSYMAHESGHAALEIFKYIGATINPEEDQECFCYLLGTVFRLLNGAFYELKEFKPKSKTSKKK